MLIGVVAALSMFQSSCCGTRQLGTPQEIPRKSPKALFLAYVKFGQERQYASMLECMAPSVRASCCSALLEKKRFDRKAAALAADVEKRYACDLPEWQVFMGQVEDAYLGAFGCHPGGFDYSTADYVRMGDVVLPTREGSYYRGLVAVRHSGEWHLSNPNPRTYAEEMKMLVDLLRLVNGKLDRARRKVSSGRVAREKLGELLSEM